MTRHRSKTWVAALAAALVAVAAAQEVEEEYRSFTGANGKVIEAVLIDKTDDSVTLLVKNGGRATVPLDKLSEEDRAYVADWSKDKAIFLQQCRGLTIRELLELRGYEAFPIRFENNSIYVNGKLNGKETRFLIDTGAGRSLIDVPFAKEAGCEIGPMDERIFGVAGEAEAGWTTVKSFQLGESEFTDRRFLATELKLTVPEGGTLRHDAILGAELLGTLDAVLTYKDRMMFLRPDLSDEAEVDVDRRADDGGEGALRFRLFKTKDGKVFRGAVVSKSPTSVKLQLVKGGERSLNVSRLIPEDQAYVHRWTEAGDLFLRYCGGLTVEELLKLRQYQSFEYHRRGTHIFVDGTLNGNDVTYMIDTGADNSVLNLHAAKENDCEVGPMDQKVWGIGGWAKAAVARIKEVTMGDAKLTNRKVLATDLASRREDKDLGYVGMFGADFMRELDAVITYRESRIFLIQHR